MQSRTLLFLVLGLAPAILFAQQAAPCGTTRADLNAITHHLKINQEYLSQHPGVTRLADITYVPVKFHIVKKDNGTGGIEEYKVFDMLCGLNEFYADQDIQFYMKGGFNTFNDSDVYDNPRGPAGAASMSSKRFKAFLNVFLTNQTGEANVLGYYTADWPTYQGEYIVIRRSEIKSKKYTIEHEMGHYFSILHPFNGWECEEWDPGVHGNPNTYDVAPCNSLDPPYSNVLVELASGSNSSNAGDFLSDTPADYNLGLGWPNCNYQGGAKDKNGVLLDPDEENIMGYFSSCSDYHFSQEQKDLIAADLVSRQNAGIFNNRYLNTNEIPEQADPGPSVAVFPEDEGFSNNIANVTLEWEAGPGAEGYAIRIDRLTTFGFMPRYYYTTEPQVTLDFDLNDGKVYYWQVFPYNEWNTCAGWGELFSFTAGQPSSVTTIPGLESLSIVPNPVQAGQPLQVQLIQSSPLDLEWRIVDLTGRLVATQPTRQLPAGNHLLTWENLDLLPGTYLVQFRTSNGLRSERLVVH